MLFQILCQSTFELNPCYKFNDTFRKELYAYTTFNIYLGFVLKEYKK